MPARAAVAYVRETHEARGMSWSAQRSAIEAWAAREAVTIACWQVDVGIDGTTPIAERPGLLAAYRAIREHGAGILVAANAERFTRDELVAWLIEQAALVEGATLRTADGSAPARKAAPAEASYTRGAIDLARAYDRVVARARMRTLAEEKKARGERVGTLPYGYRLAADGVHLEAEPSEQAVLSMVHALRAEGLSQRAIVARLGERGVTGRTGAPLRQTQIATILGRRPG